MVVDGGPHKYSKEKLHTTQAHLAQGPSSKNILSGTTSVDFAPEVFIQKWLVQLSLQMEKFLVFTICLWFERLLTYVDFENVS